MRIGQSFGELYIHLEDKSDSYNDNNVHIYKMWKMQHLKHKHLFEYL